MPHLNCTLWLVGSHVRHSWHLSVDWDWYETLQRGCGEARGTRAPRPLKHCGQTSTRWPTGSTATRPKPPPRNPANRHGQLRCSEPLRPHPYRESSLQVLRSIIEVIVV